MKSISADALKAECLKERYSSQLSRPEVFPSDENWQYIIGHSMTGIGPGLYRKYIVSWLIDPSERCDYHQAALTRFPEYLSAVPRQYALDVVYADIDSAPGATLDVIHRVQLFDAPRLLGLLADEECPRVGFVADCLDAYQPEYTLSDLTNMRTLLGALRDLPPLGKITRTRTLLGQTDRYVCPRGHVNDITDDYCRADNCGLNIYGLTERQDRLVDGYADRVRTLGKLLV